LIVNPLSAVYGTAATWRRRWYAARPARARRLARPVVSVGSLRVGGSGKTPIVAHLAQLLLAHGERPSILIRGYRRQRATSGVTVVSDGTRVRADLASSGDEALMLARALPGVSVLVGADRFSSGVLAEGQLGVTVHLLDDGFQHVQLARAVDLLLVDERDLHEAVLPAGWLREPVGNASAAHAALVTAAHEATVAAVASSLGVSAAFRIVRSIHAPRRLTLKAPAQNDAPSTVDDALALDPERPVLALAGIARPDRFFSDLASAGWRVGRTLAFSDHHPFSERDITRIVDQARACGASLVLTTEKDAVRLEGHGLPGLTVASVPLTAAVEPAEDFTCWLLGRLEPGQTVRAEGGVS
jgi:tetraacyldisaccharide 4'-kinase